MDDLVQGCVGILASYEEEALIFLCCFIILCARKETDSSFCEHNSTGPQGYLIYMFTISLIHTRVCISYFDTYSNPKIGRNGFMNSFFFILMTYAVRV